MPTLTDEDVGLKSLTDADVGLPPESTEPIKIATPRQPASLTGPRSTTAGAPQKNWQGIGQAFADDGIPLTKRYAEAMEGVQTDISDSPVSRFVAPRPSPSEGRIQLPEATIKPDDSFAVAALKESWNTVKGLPEFATSDLGVMTALTGSIGGPLVSRLVAGGYSADMLWHAYQTAKDSSKGFDSMTPAMKAKTLVDIISSVGMAGLLAKHAADTKVPKPGPMQGPLQTGRNLKTPAGAEPSATAQAMGAVGEGIELEGGAVGKLSPVAEAAIADIANRGAPLTAGALHLIETSTKTPVADLPVEPAATAAQPETKPNAIPERSTETPAVGETPRGSQAVGQGAPKPEEPSVPQGEGGTQKAKESEVANEHKAPTAPVEEPVSGEPEAQAGGTTSNEAASPVEKLTPAIRVNGKTFTGTDHLDAYRNAKENGQPDTSGAVEGFVDQNGQWTTREKAADATGLPTETEDGKLHSSDLTPALTPAPTATESPVANAEAQPEVKPAAPEAPAVAASPEPTSDLFPDLKGRAPTLERVRRAIEEEEAKAADLDADSDALDASERKLRRLRALGNRLESDAVKAAPKPEAANVETKATAKAEDWSPPSGFPASQRIPESFPDVDSEIAKRQATRDQAEYSKEEPWNKLKAAEAKLEKVKRTYDDTKIAPAQRAVDRAKKVWSEANEVEYKARQLLDDAKDSKWWATATPFQKWVWRMQREYLELRDSEGENEQGAARPKAKALRDKTIEAIEQEWQKAIERQGFTPEEAKKIRMERFTLADSVFSTPLDPRNEIGKMGEWSAKSHREDKIRQQAREEISKLILPPQRSWKIEDYDSPQETARKLSGAREAASELARQKQADADKAEALAKEEQEKEITKARTLSESGKLQWAMRGTDKNMVWRAVEGKPIKLKADPSRQYFVYKSGIGQWSVVESSTGRSLGADKTQGEAAKMAEERISSDKKKYDDLVDSLAKRRPRSPTLNPLPNIPPPSLPTSKGKPPSHPYLAKPRSRLPPRSRGR